MPEELNANPPQPAPLPNDPASRTPDGTLKDQSQAPTSSQTATTTDTSTPTEPAAPKPEPTYTAFTAPEGKELDKALVDRATPLFKELGLDQANAQKLVDLYNTLAGDNAKATQKLVDEMREGWRREVAVHPEIGGKLDQVKADIGRMKDAIFGSDAAARKAFDDGMNLTGAGDYPAIIAAWWKASQKFTEGTHVSGAQPSVHGQTDTGTKTRPSHAQALYPNLN